MQKNTQKARALISIGSAIVFTVFAIVILWITYNDIETFRATHKDTVTNQVSSASVSIERFLDERLRYVETFTVEKSDLIAAMSQAPDNEELRKKIEQELAKLFPLYFTFTLTDTRGNDQIADIEGFVGEICLASIYDFISQRKSVHATQTHYYEVEIHPQANNYHFDMMAPWYANGELKGVFFISFFPDLIQEILVSHETEDHRLYVVHREKAGLIEITSEGARDKFGAHREIYLTPWETENILGWRAVKNSRWIVIGLPAPGLFSDYSQSRWTVAGLAILVFGVLITLSAAFAIRRTAKRHADAK
ncbi:cache domain-containing protein [Hwanghaeella sp.]|uniref:cache domain-containing protein n=1 Tax=Hwanghaeella sp. TaxID=2605943 RepID=UPI003CCC0745